LALLSQLAVAPRYPGWDDEDLDRETLDGRHRSPQGLRRPPSIPLTHWLRLTGPTPKG
jgi:hypothetical protein